MDRTSRHGVLRPDLAQGEFTLARHAPSATLAHVVDWYWIVRYRREGRPVFRQETLPHPCVNVVVEHGREGVYGPTTGRFAIDLVGDGFAVGVKFRPGGFAPFAGFPMAALTERSLPMASIFGADAAAAIDRIRATEDDLQATQALEALLLPRAPERDEARELVGSVVARIATDTALVRVDDVARAAGVSVRSLERLFLRYVGVSPKWVIRRLRIHEAAERIGKGEVRDFARLAVDLGYYDQPHFVRDFRSQIGVTPSAYALRRRVRETESAASMT